MYKLYCPQCNEYSYSASRNGCWFCSNCGKKIEKNRSEMKIRTA